MYARAPATVNEISPCKQWASLSLSRSLRPRIRCSFLFRRNGWYSVWVATWSLLRMSEANDVWRAFLWVWVAGIPRAQSLFRTVWSAKCEWRCDIIITGVYYLFIVLKFNPMQFATVATPAAHRHPTRVYFNPQLVETIHVPCLMVLLFALGWSVPMSILRMPPLPPHQRTTHTHVLFVH